MYSTSLLPVIAQESHAETNPANTEKHKDTPGVAKTYPENMFADGLSTRSGRKRKNKRKGAVAVKIGAVVAFFVARLKVMDKKMWIGGEAENKVRSWPANYNFAIPASAAFELHKRFLLFFLSLYTPASQKASCLGAFPGEEKRHVAAEMWLSMAEALY